MPVRLTMRSRADRRSAHTVPAGEEAHTRAAVRGAGHVPSVLLPKVLLPKVLGLLWPFRRIRPASVGSRRRRGHRSAGSLRSQLHAHRLAAGQQLESRLALAVFGPLDTALPPVQRGSFVYASAVEQLSTLAAPTDVVDVTTTLAPGSSLLSALVHPLATLQVRVDILDANGAVLATRSATRPGEIFTVGPINVAAGGTYTVRHLSVGGTTGTVTTGLQLDVRPEGEAIGGHTNDTLATAESLTPSIMTFGTATRGAVFGDASIGDVDTYNFTLTAGQPLSVNFSGEGPGGILTLHDAAGVVVATGVAGANFTTLIDAYTAPAAGTYYLKFNNNSGARLGYSLVTMSNGRLEIESNDSIATAGAVPVGGTMLASLGGESVIDPLNPYRVDSLPFRFFFNALGQFDAAVDQRWSGQRIGFLSTSTLQVAGTNYNAQGRPGTVTFPVVSSVHAAADASWLRVVGQPRPGVEFERLFSWRAGDTYVTVTTTIRNVSATAISGVKVLESHNPTPNRVAATSNDVTRGGKLVVATASGVSVGLATSDPRAVLSAQGDTLGGQLQVDPSGVLAAPIDPNGATSDTAINAAFDLGTIAAGGSASCTFAMLFGSGQPALESLFDTLTIVPATGVDVDVFAVAAAAGQTLEFQTLTPGARLGDNPDVRLDLLDQAGNVLAGDDDGAADGRNALLSQRFATAGTYYVRVSASAKPGTSPRGGSYALTVSPPSITTTGTLAGLATTYGTASATTQIAVNGFALAGAITASAPAGFEVSSDGTAFGPTATFAPTFGRVSGALTVRLAAATAAGTYSGSVSFVSTGATTSTAAVPASTVAAKLLTVSGASAVNRPYDGTTTVTVSGGSLVGVVGLDAVSLVGGGNGTGTMADANIGTGKPVTVTGYALTGAAAGNYALSQPAGVTVDILAPGGNQAPTAVTLANATSVIAENTSTAAPIKLADIVITDDLLGTNTITLTGADAAAFEVVGLGLYLKAGVVLDFEAKQSYAVTVNVADTTVAGSVPVSAGLTLAVTDVNDMAPVFTSGGTGSVTESAPVSTPIYTAAVSDADGTPANRVVSYSIKPGVGDAAFVQIDPATGVVTLLASPVFVTKPSYAFTVVATNAGTGATLVAEQAVTVAVTTVNAAPTAVALANVTSTIAENTFTLIPIKVADIVITDDPLGTNTITLTGADAGSFVVSELGLYLKAGVVLDFETKQSYAVTVNVADTTVAGSVPVSTDFTLSLTDVNDWFPVFTSGGTGSVAENAAVSTPIYTAVVSDADGTAANRQVSYSIKPGVGDAALVSVDPATGVVTLLAPAVFATKPSYAFTVVATNAGTGAKLVAEQAVAVAVTTVNGPPQVAESSIAAGDVLPVGPLSYVVTFSTAMNAGSLTAPGSFLLYDDMANTFITPVAVTPSIDAVGRSVATVDFGTVAESRYVLQINGPTDLAGIALGGPTVPWSVPFSTDAATVPFAPLVPAAPPVPRGSLVYGSAVDHVVTLALPTDVDDVTLSLAPGGSLLTAFVQPGPTLQVRVEVIDGAGTVLFTQEATRPGEAFRIGPFDVAAGGTYTFRYSALAGTTGAAATSLLLGALPEAEAPGGHTNDTVATAEPLSPSLVSIGTFGRTAVVGTIAGSVTVFADGFESGVLGPAWTTFSSAGGRVEVSGWERATGLNALLMDQPGNVANLNEAVLTVDLSGIAGTAFLDFSHMSIADQDAAFTGSFTGHANADGVAISADGLTWYPVWNATGDVWSWGRHSLDISAAAAQAGISMGAGFQIKFQQFGSGAYDLDGRFWDDIAIRSFQRDTDTYSIELAAGQTLSAVLTGAGGAGSLSLYDAAGGLVADGGPAGNFNTVITGYTAAAGGTYYLAVSNPLDVDLRYSLVATPGGQMEIERNDDIGSAQAVTVGGTVLAALGNPETVVDGPVRLAGTPFVFTFNPLGHFDGEQGWAGERFGFLSTWTLQLSGTNYNTQDRHGVVNTVTFPVVATVRTDGTTSWMRVTGEPMPGVMFERVVSWRSGDDYATVTTTIRNTSADAIAGVKLLESQNPDPGYAFQTENDVTRGGRLVAATAFGLSMGLATNDPRAVLSVDGEPLLDRLLAIDPAAVLATPIDPNGAVADTAINAAFDLGTLAAGDSASCTFAMLFGYGQASLEMLYDSLAIGPVTAEDVDLYAVTVSAGQTLQFETLTPGGAVGDLPDVRLDLLDQAGNVLAGDDNGAADGRNALLTQRFAASGTFYVRVSASATATAATRGSYALVVTAPAIDTAPVFTSGTTGTVDENAPITTAIYTAVATDANAALLTYSIKPGAGDAALVDIDAATGVVTLRTSADFETQASYAFIVVATRVGAGGTLAAEQAVTVSVTDVNEAPTAVTLTSVIDTLPENTDTAVGVLLADIAVTDDALGTNEITLTGVDAASFEVIGTSLFLRAGVLLDFETQASYAVTVSVVDPTLPGSVPVTVDYTLTVTDVNEAPTAVTLTVVADSLPENTDTAAGILLADIVVADDALGTNEITLTGVDAASFEVIGTSLFLKAGVLLDFETQASYAVTVSVFDPTLPDSVPVTVDYTLTVTDVNEAPTAVTLTVVADSLPENTDTAAGILLADIVVADDAIGTNEITLTGVDAASFEVIGTSLFLRAGVLLDFETQASYAVTVTVADPTLPDSVPVTVDYTLTVTDVNEAPTAVTLTVVADSLPENTDTAAGVLLADIAVTDDALGTNEITLTGVDAASFEVIGTSLFLRAGVLLDFETQASYAVTVSVVDPTLPGSVPVTVDYILTVTDVNEAPTAVTLTVVADSLPENTDTAVGVLLADIVVADDAIGTNEIALTGVDAASFEVIGTSLFLRAGVLLDFETQASYAVTVSVFDPTLTDSVPVTVDYTLTVTDVNEAPTAVTLTVVADSLPENTDTAAGILLADIAVTDDALGMNDITLTGVDAASFEVIDTSLFLRAGVVLDFQVQASYAVTVSVVDPTLPGSVPVTVDYTLTVTDINRAPTAVTLTSVTNSLPENTDTAAGILLAGIAVTDDALGANEITLTGADAASFEVIGTSLFLKAGVVLDFETQASYAVTVSVVDPTLPGSVPVTVDYTLAVTDVNEAPTAVRLTAATTSLPENTRTTSPIKVADLAVADDALGTNEITLSGADAASFEVIGTSLFLKAGVVLDFETRTSYAVTVSVVDPTLPGSTPVTTGYTLAVTDVNEAPTAVRLTGVTTSLPKNVSTKSRIKLADIVVADDAQGTNEIKLTGPNAKSCEVIGTSLYLKAGEKLAKDVNKQYKVTLSVADPTMRESVPVTVGYSLAVTNGPVAPVISLGTGVADGATAGEATQASGVATVSGEAGAKIAVTLQGKAGKVVRSVVGQGTGVQIPIVLASGDTAKLGDGLVTVTATASDTFGNTSPAGSAKFTLDTVAPNAARIALGPGVAGGATAATATQPSGVLTLAGEAKATQFVTLTGTAGQVSRTIVGKGDKTTVPFVLTAADVQKLGDGVVTAAVTVVDPAGNRSSVASTQFTLDTKLPVGPSVPFVAIPASGTYRPGDKLRFAVTFPEAVTVKGVPFIDLTLDDGKTGRAYYVEGSGTSTLVFQYLVKAGDKAANGPRLAAAISGSIVNAAGTPVSLSLAGAPSLAGVVIVPKSVKAAAFATL